MTPTTRPARRRSGSARRRLATALGLVALTALALLAAAIPAQALTITPGTFSARAHVTQPDGSDADVTQAGSHPDYTVSFRFDTVSHAPGESEPDGSVKDIRIDLPHGLVGNPQATPQCSHRDFTLSLCPNATMVGTDTLDYAPFPEVPVSPQLSAVYNLTPPKGTVARFGFQLAVTSIIIDMRVNDDGSYNLSAELNDLSQEMLVFGSELTLWGVPADHNGTTGPYTLWDGRAFGDPSGQPRVPFLTAPTACQPDTATMAADSWQHPGDVTVATAEVPSWTGCDKLAFAPTLDLRPDDTRAGEPAGYAVTVDVPQNDDPDGLATPAVSDVDVQLPAGVSVSPSSVQGLDVCTDEQAAFHTLADPSCPAASKIGTVQIDTPLLSVPLTGGVYLGRPLSMSSDSGEMLRLFLVASGQGVTVKLEGRIRADPSTGVLHALFADTPQLPFSRLSLRLKGGSTAPLTNPQSCGTYTTHATISSWGQQVQTSDSTFTIDRSASGGPCAPLGFSPTFHAGTTNPQAGAFSPFTLSFGRSDSDQDLGSLTARLPRGLTGLLASAELCPEAQAAAGTCGAGSRIGTATVVAGPGTTPLTVQTDDPVYITGPYRGAPFGLSIVVPAVAGPFDLGTVVVRASIAVDRTTAALTIASDPLPTVLDGIPLRVRDVSVAIDRPGFMLNPTSCTARSVNATVTSAEGASAPVSSRFQAGGCRALPFKPSLSLSVGKRGRTRAGLTTPFRARLTARRGDGNLRSVSVKLPKTLSAQLAVVTRPCTLDEFHAGRCTKRVGSATAVTPLLSTPLRGPAYFVRVPGRRLPDLMVALHGQVDIDLAGRVSIPRDLTLKTVFDTIPDVPIRSFELDLVAGRLGTLSAISNLCAPATRRASVATIGYRAQSGKLIQARKRLAVSGCGKR
jgi:hypothetical protein